MKSQKNRTMEYSQKKRTAEVDIFTIIFIRHPLHNSLNGEKSQLHNASPYDLIALKSLLIPWLLYILRPSLKRQTHGRLLDCSLFPQSVLLPEVVVYIFRIVSSSWMVFSTVINLYLLHCDLPLWELAGIVLICG
ncbi:hypothetical protein TNCT_268741 [Trichonephila clavata]|uniref:Uncharacterized protein n=1 Tax=Trichonephila clavata TaxID=2740835 RepID=A0A8X6G431_TRICU|nr:hypothetical protein TNCT_268741 [Trichonephila clavata]